MPASQQGALIAVKRWAWAVESAGLRSSPGSFTVPRGYEGAAFRALRNFAPDQRQLDSRRRKYRAWPGAKSCEMNLQFPAHDGFVTDYGKFFEAAFGAEQATSALGAVTGTNDETDFEVASGDPGLIVKVTLSDGLVLFRPVKTVSGQTGEYAIELPPLGGRTVTSIENATALWFESPGANVTSFQIECDRGAENSEVPYTGQGMVVSDLGLTTDFQGRLMFSLGLQGVDWTQAAVANVSDPLELTNQFAGAVDVAIQSLSTPAALAQKNLSNLQLQFAPSWIPQAGSSSRTSSGTNPGSNVFAYKPATHFDQPVQTTLNVADKTKITEIEASTKNQAFFTFYDGQGGSTPSKAVCIWYPEMEQTAEPESTDVAGVEGYILRHQVQEDRNLGASRLTKCAVAFFG